ncbi:FAD binding protein [Histoplasma capsulatum H143]|uniref:FAD binding protein n=1 Tax=Ajellomyces capsulatus (strain H143) TaxID=544712 RepID=C6HGS7_AJECH|nr:FAD binding protein [Histoplasma capsulatum H143]
MKRAHSVTPPRKLKMGPSADGEGFMDGHGGLHTPPPTTTVAVVGAGPSGLMLASNLVRYGIKTTILDDRPDKTSTGKADGMQPKTIETFKQLRLADDLLRKGVKVYDISFWESTVDKPLHRTSRQSHYPDHVGASNPFVLLAHQGMIEDVLIQDMEQRGVFVSRSSPFIECSRSAADGKMHVIYEDATTKAPRTMEADYLIGCDGAHSKVRPFIPEAKLIGEMTNASWGVLDGVINTDFPDLWSKVAVRTHHAGSILWIPRERNMTRLICHQQSQASDGTVYFGMEEHWLGFRSPAPRRSKANSKKIEWFGNYVVSQRVANHFADAELQIFIAGDVNSSVPDTSLPSTVLTYPTRPAIVILPLRPKAPTLACTTASILHGSSTWKKIAQDLIDFDAGHVKAFSEGDEALTRNFDENIRFISGVGAEYAPNILNQVSSAPQLPGSSINILKPGALLTPARVTRFIDANPVDIELDIPLLSQFRIYMFTPSLQAGTAFLENDRQQTIHARVKLFTYALVTRRRMRCGNYVVGPRLLQASRSDFFNLDDVIPGGGCTEKWLGNVPGDEVAIVNVRPGWLCGSIWRCGGCWTEGGSGVRSGEEGR